MPSSIKECENNICVCLTDVQNLKDRVVRATNHRCGRRVYMTDKEEILMPDFRIAACKAQDRTSRMTILE